MIRARIGDERGWAVVTTMLVMAIMMTIALPLMTLVDTQQRGTSEERRSEGSFTVAEAALNSMVFLLSSEWPAAVETRYPSSCTEASTTIECPDATAIARTYDGVDFSDLAWTVKLRDDTGSEYYSASDVELRPTWDENDNQKVWLRADGRASGRSRTIVALVRLNEQVETLPRRVISAGWFATTNGGNKVIVDTQGDAAEPATLAVRCLDARSQSCLGYDSAKRQVSPELVEVDAAGDTALAPSVINGLREKADSMNTYYKTGCPSSPAGKLVFIESASCTYSGSGAANTDASPGMIVMGSGSLTIGGNFTYYGVIYAANLNRSTGAMVTLGGSTQVVGSISVDYGGGVLAGASGKNLTYSEKALPDIRSHRTVGIVQGSWRELPAS